MPRQKDDLTAEINEASPQRLVLINYELIIKNLREAVGAFKAGDIKAFEKKLGKAREFLNLCMTTLDMSHDVSKDLMKVYIYINGLLIKAAASKSTEPVRNASGLISKIHESFEANIRFTAAGSNINDGKLADINADANRGFKA